MVAGPSITKYIEGGVITKDETPNNTYYPASPAVTFCASKHNTGFDRLSNETLSLYLWFRTIWKDGEQNGIEKFCNKTTSKGM